MKLANSASDKASGASRLLRIAPPAPGSSLPGDEVVSDEDGVPRSFSLGRLPLCEIRDAAVPLAVWAGYRHSTPLVAHLEHPGRPASQRAFLFAQRRQDRGRATGPPVFLDRQ